MTTRLCWKCKYFIATNAETSLAGICVRNAPKNADFVSYYALSRYSMTFNFGYVGDPSLQGGDILPLIKGGWYLDTPTCHASNAQGLATDDINPFAVGSGAKIKSVAVYAARMNTGAATVGTNPVLHLRQKNVVLATQTDGAVIDIPIPASMCNPTGTAVDKLVVAKLNFDPNANTGIYTCSGFVADLTGSTENDIAAIRNLGVQIIMESLDADTPNTPVSSAGKFGQISDGTTMQCGDFALSETTIPAIPEI